MNFKERFPELWAMMSTVSTRKDLLKVCRAIQKGSDEGDLTIPYCDGAFLAFKEELLEQWRSGQSSAVASPEEARARRILNITYSDGSRKARSMNGRTRLY
jgi:hypothetical protein